MLVLKTDSKSLVIYTVSADISDCPAKSPTTPRERSHAGWSQEKSPLRTKGQKRPGGGGQGVMSVAGDTVLTRPRRGDSHAWSRPVLDRHFIMLRILNQPHTRDPEPGEHSAGRGGS